MADLPADEPVPAWAVEGVHLVAADPQWPALARVFATELRMAFGAVLVGPVEHVGSTAVPGLAAKPVVDLMARVADHDVVARGARDRLAELHWAHVPPELDGQPGRRLFVRVSPDGLRRLAHLHLMPVGAPRWDEQLAFRDALRADPGLRDRYAALKTGLAAEHATDREAYTAAKADFVADALAAAPGSPT